MGVSNEDGGKVIRFGNVFEDRARRQKLLKDWMKMVEEERNQK